MLAQVVGLRISTNAKSGHVTPSRTTGPSDRGTTSHWGRRTPHEFPVPRSESGKLDRRGATVTTPRDRALQSVNIVSNVPEELGKALPAAKWDAISARQFNIG